MAFFIVILGPFILLGYYAASRHVLTTSIILTVFQTNPGEAIAYLKNNNPLIWISLVLAGIAMIAILFRVLISIVEPMDYNQSRTGTIFLLVCLMLFCGGKGISKANYTIGYMLYSQTKQSLQEYKAYGEAKEKRLNHLENLVHLTVNERKGGLFLLIIGESETRDHMQVYGYPKETTPWLNKASKEAGSILFTNAYSNHTHTVPTLTYALTEKNQYNSEKLKNAYSIIETARAAGYETYWLSNQVKYGIYDTPIAEIASVNANIKVSHLGSKCS